MTSKIGEDSTIVADSKGCTPNLASGVLAEGTFATEAKDAEISSSNCLTKEVPKTSSLPLELTCNLTIKAIVEI